MRPIATAAAQPALPKAEDVALRTRELETIETAAGGGDRQPNVQPGTAKGFTSFNEYKQPWVVQYGPAAPLPPPPLPLSPNPRTRLFQRCRAAAVPEPPPQWARIVGAGGFEPGVGAQGNW